MMSRYNDRAYTAHHEAGHALMMTVLDVGVRSICILTDSTEFNGETVPTRWGRRKLNRIAKKMMIDAGNGPIFCRANFLVAMAGPIAGAVYAGEWPPAVQNRLELCRRLFHHDKGDWSIIDRGLRGYYFSDQVKDQLLWGSCVQVHKVLNIHWRKLTILARLLIARGELHYCGIRRVVRGR